MYNSDLLYSIILFVVYLFPQAMFINGIYLASRGSSEIRPDGKEHLLSEMILYPLAKYLEQHTMSKIFYTDDRLSQFIEQVMDTFPVTSTFEITEFSVEQRRQWASMKAAIEKTFDVKMSFFSNLNDTYDLQFYREYTIYRFSKYIRKPLFGCIICMSSFWGLLTFLLPALAFFHLDPIVLALYVFNTPCLAYLAYKINKPL